MVSLLTYLLTYHLGIGMTETVDVFYQETNYVTLLIFWLLIDVCFLLLHVSFIFDCLVYFSSLFCTTCTIL